jgi:glycosyltransferase involved in cell wall biosynthesis
MRAAGAKVSVIIPARNAARWIRDAITSVFAQTVPVHECIVVDDGSTDDTGRVTAELGGGVDVVTTGGGGVAVARNAGAARATGDYLAFLDADDVWLPRKLELQLAAFRDDPGLGLVYTGLHVVDEELRFIGRQNVPSDDEAIRKTLLVERPIMPGIGSTALVPAERFRELGGFDERYSPSADCALACAIGIRYRVHGVPRPLVLYRQHPAAMHWDPRNAIERDMRSIHSELLPRLSPPASIRRARANLHVSLAGSALATGRPRDAARHAVLAFVARPDRVLAAAWRLSRPAGGLKRAP